jgi:hypothetical protein
MSELLHITKCRLCPKQFQAPPLPVPIIGQPAPVHTFKYVEVLAKHMQSKHPKEWQALLNLTNQYAGLLTIRAFETADPALQKAEDLVRFSLHQITRRNPPPDDSEIWKNLNEHGLQGNEDAFKAVVELRDYLMEAEFVKANNPNLAPLAGVESTPNGSATTAAG